MTEIDRQAHWQAIYQSKGEKEVSWFQESAGPSLDLLARIGANAASAVIDIGGGSSRLVDELMARGFSSLTVLDLSEAALTTAKTRLGDKASLVQWIVADVTTWEPTDRYDVWHDRAAFHFLTEERDRAAYVSRLKAALKPGGCAVVATFALDGPERCSGLPIVRYDAETLGRVLGRDFELVETHRAVHATPLGAEQRFQFSVFRFIAAG